MTTLCLGDPHWNDKRVDTYRHDFVRQQLLPLLTRNVDRVIILGDLTTDKDRHSAELVNQVVTHLADIAQRAKSIIVLCGNHDYAAEGHPFFEFVNHMPRVTWVGKPWFMDDIDLGPCLFLPHSPDPERDWSPELRRRKYNYIFTHATFDGARGENGQKLSGLSWSIFPAGTRVISGDVHVPQTVGPVIYAGAPYRINFGDVYTPRVLLLRGTKISSLIVKGPRKCLIEAGDQTTDISPGDLVKVRVKVSLDEYAHWAQIKEEWRLWANEQQVTLVQVQPVLDRTQELQGAAPRRAEVIPDNEILTAYGTARRVDPETMAIGHEIANEV